MQTFTFTALDQSLDLASLSESVFLHFQIIGSGVMTVTLEDSFDDGVTYAAQRLRDMASGAGVAGMSVAGLYRTPDVCQFRQPRLRCSAFTSGSLTVKAITTPLAF